MKITPVKGTADYLPNEVLIRDYLQNSILEKMCIRDRDGSPEKNSRGIIGKLKNL